MTKPPLSSFAGTAPVQKPPLGSFAGTPNPLNGFASTDAKMNPIQAAGMQMDKDIVLGLQKRGDAVIDTVTRGAEALQKPTDYSMGDLATRTGALASTGLQTAGAVAGSAKDIGVAGTKALFSVIPKDIKNPVVNTLTSVINTIGNIPQTYGSKKTFSDSAKFAMAGIAHLWDQLSPEEKRNVEAAGNIGALLLANKTSPDLPGVQKTKDALATIPADIGKAKDAVVNALPDMPTVDGVTQGVKKLPGVKQYVTKRAEEQAKAAELITSGNTTDARTAKYTMSKTYEGHDVVGDIRKDPLALEAIKQGMDEGDVALIKSASPGDKAKMKEMLETTLRAKTDKTVLDRSTDVVGRTFSDPARHIQGINKEAGKALDDIAKTELAGKPVDITGAYKKYLKDLEGRGVTLDVDGKLDFTGSDFEGLDSVQKTLNRMNDRIGNLDGGDAYGVHQAKRFIDEQVQYGKQAEGLTGGAERIVKNFRHNADEALDAAFPAYNEVNTQFAETRDYLDELQRLLGKNTPLSDELAAAKAGTLMRRVLSNAGSRTDVMRLIANTEELGKKYGFNTDNSIIRQVLFADTIENTLGTEASTSLFGQVERATRAAGAAKDLSQGNVLGAVTKGGLEAYNKLQNITPEAKIEAIRKLLDAIPEEKLPKALGGVSKAATALSDSPLDEMAVAKAVTDTPLDDMVTTEAFVSRNFDEFARPMREMMPEMSEAELKSAYETVSKWKNDPVIKQLVDYKLAVSGGSAVDSGKKVLSVLDDNPVTADEIATASKELLKGTKKLYRYGDKEGLSWTTKPDEFFAGVGDAKRPLQTIDVTDDILDRVAYAEGAEKKLGYTAFPNSGEGEVLLKPVKSALNPVAEAVTAKKTFLDRLDEGYKTSDSEVMITDAKKLPYRDFVKKYEAYDIDRGGMSEGKKAAHAVIQKDNLVPTEADSWETFRDDFTVKYDKKIGMEEVQKYYKKEFTPPLVEDIGNGEYAVIDGHHRVANLIKDGSGDIPVYFDRRTLQKMWQKWSGKKITLEEGNKVYSELFPAWKKGDTQ